MKSPFTLKDLHHPLVHLLSRLFVRFFMNVARVARGQISAQVYPLTPNLFLALIKITLAIPYLFPVCLFYFGCKPI